MPAGVQLGVAPVRARHVVGHGGVPVFAAGADVRGDALAVMEQLDGVLGDARVDHLRGSGGRGRE